MIFANNPSELLLITCNQCIHVVVHNSFLQSYDDLYKYLYVDLLHFCCIYIIIIYICIHIAITKYMQNKQNTDEITTETLAELRARLPHGYSKTLVKIIKRKHKKQYTAQHIRRTLCIVPKKLPNLILEEAVKLADKQEGMRRSITRKMNINEWDV